MASYPYTWTAELLSPYGLLAPSTETSPIWHPDVKFGQGLDIWEGTTNLITNPSFETGLTGHAGAGSATIATDTSRAMVGTQCCKVTLATAVGFGTGDSYAIGTGVLANSTVYTASAWVYVPSGSPRAVLSVQGGIVASAQSSAPSSVNDRWQRLTCTFTSSASAATSTGSFYVLNNDAATAGQVFYVDAIQLEQKNYATPYCDGRQLGCSWTGSADASTSTRTGSVLEWASLTLPATVAGCAWIRIGSAKASSDGGAASYASLLEVTDAGRNNGILLARTSDANIGAGTVNGGSFSANAAATFTPAAGDLMFCYFDSAGTFYGAKNGGSLQTATTTAFTGASGLPTKVRVGSKTANIGTSDCAFEQVLIFSSVLSSGQVTALATTANTVDINTTSVVGSAGPVGIPAPIFAAGTGKTKGTTSALVYNPASTLDYTSIANVPAALDPISRVDTSIETPPTGTIWRLSTQGSLGAGVGSVVRCLDMKMQVLGVTTLSGGDLIYTKPI